MTPQEFQEIVTTIHGRRMAPVWDDLHDLEWSTLALAGEVGELANVVKKMRRDGPPATNMLRLADRATSELADVLTYAAVVAACLGRTFQSVMEQAAEQSIEWDRGRR